MTHNEISANILGVTVLEFLSLEATARGRDECTCLTCIVGDGDLLCVGCHYRYSVCGDLCVKCYSYEDYCRAEEAAVEAAAVEAEEMAGLVLVDVVDASGRVYTF